MSLRNLSSSWPSSSKPSSLWLSSSWLSSSLQWVCQTLSMMSQGLPRLAKREDGSWIKTRNIIFSSRLGNIFSKNWKYLNEKWKYYLSPNIWNLDLPFLLGLSNLCRCRYLQFLLTCKKSPFPILGTGLSAQRQSQKVPRERENYI